MNPRELAVWAERERLLCTGAGWREAFGLTSETAETEYTIWWRFELADNRRLRESCP